MSEDRSAAGAWGPGRRRIVRSLWIAVCGFACMAVVVHLFLRDPLRMHADIRSEKLAILDEWQGKAYSAVFGSSHMHAGFDPRVFDVAVAGSDLATRSLNLAIAGGSQTEQRAMALEFVRHLQAPPRSSTGQADAPRSCLMLLELNAGANFTTEHLVHPRAINLYDWQTTRFVSQLTSSRMSRQQRYGRQFYAWLAMAMHYLNIGMLSSKIFAPPVDAAALRYETVEDRRGIYAGLEAKGDVRAAVEAKLRAMTQPPKPEPGELDPGNFELVQEVLRASPVQHLQVVYVVSPKLADLDGFPIYPESLQAGGQQVPIFNLARPDQFPELYKASFWHDDTHLDPAGARMATEILAGQAKTWFSAHGGLSPCGG